MPRNRRVLLSVIAIFLVMAGIITVIALSESGRTPIALSPAVERATGYTLIQQASLLNKTYQRMHSLGWPIKDISYNDGKPGDMLRTQKFLEEPRPPAPTVAFADAVWQMGGGTILETYAENTHDVVFFLPGLKQDICRQVNTQLWQDSASTSPLQTPSSIEKWKSRTATTLGLFAGKNRSEACVVTPEGLFLYYKVVWSPKNKTDTPEEGTVENTEESVALPTPPAPTMPAPPPLPPGADPELKVP